MIFTFDETPASRSETIEPPTYTIVYKAVGEQDEDVVVAYALAATPIYVFRPRGTLIRKDVQIDPDGWGQYTVTVPYGRVDATSAEPGSYTFSFDTQGATINIKAAKQHVATYPTSGAVDHKGAIGVKADGEPEGADIVVPACKLTYSFKHPAGIVNESFAKLIAFATGRTNLNPFRTYEQTELLFAGGGGSDGSDAEATVSYNFIAQPNENEYRIGDITGIVKKGHHYAWVEFEDDVSSGEAIRPPKRVHIERVYDEIDFASTFGWS